MTKFKGIIFDIDGTLTSTNELIIATFNHIAQKYENRIYTEEEIYAMFGPTEDVILKEKFNGDKFQSVYDDYYKFYKENHPTMADIYPGIIDLLEILKSNNLRLAIFTGKGKRTSLITLEILNIKHYFDLIITGDDVKNHKPSAEGIKKFLSEYNFEPNAVLMIGDSVADIHASHEAGVQIASVIWDSYAKGEVKKLNPNNYFRTVEELRVWLMDKI
jgi:HAD superfamily hydrolase (TIGR01509 family)